MLQIWSAFEELLRQDDETSIPLWWPQHVGSCSPGGHRIWSARARQGTDQEFRRSVITGPRLCDQSWKWSPVWWLFSITWMTWCCTQRLPQQSIWSVFPVAWFNHRRNRWPFVARRTRRTCRGKVGCSRVQPLPFVASLKTGRGLKDARTGRVNDEPRCDHGRWNISSRCQKTRKRHGWHGQSCCAFWIFLIQLDEHPRLGKLTEHKRTFLFAFEQRQVGPIMWHEPPQEDTHIRHRLLLAHSSHVPASFTRLLGVFSLLVLRFPNGRQTS